MPSRGAHSGRGARGDDKKRNSRPPQSREITISKNLSFLLRHHAADEGITLDEGGWANVADVLLWRRLASLKVTLAELNAIVSTNDKQRYQMIQNPVLTPQQQLNPDSTDPSRYIIRAVQGHSIRTISAEKLLTPILASDPDCPTLVVHGTYENLWHEIRKSGGLKPMSRTHIHFAAREPEKVPPLEVVLGGKKGRDEGGDLGEGRVLSGMRVGATVLIWVDVRRTLEGGVRWWRSENGVFLTDGVEGGVGEKEEGKGEKRERMLGLEWIRWVEKRGPKGGVLWKNEGVDVEGEKFANRMGGLSGGGKQRSGDGSDGKEKAAENGAGREGQEGGGKTGGGTSVKESWDD